MQKSGSVQKIAILYDASQAVISTFDLDEVLARILTILRDYFNLRHVAVLLLEPQSQQLRVRTHSGWNDESLGTLLTPGTGLIGAAAQQKRPIYAPDVTKDSRYISTIASTRSEIALPLLVRDEVVGVLDCQSDRPSFFDAETIDLLMLFSAHASIAIQNARLFSLEEAVRKMSGLSAEILGLRDRGRVAPGYVADLALFDPNSVQDESTYERPTETARGVEYVMLGGELAVERGNVVRRDLGRVLRRA